MTTRSFNGVWAAIAIALAVGCGDGGGGGGGASGSAGPTPTQKTAAQNAGTAGTPTSKTAEIATDAIVESGAAGSTAPKTGSQVKTATTATTTINYQASLSVTVDLDAPNSSGQDAFPNASGVFQVNATGTVTGDSMNGQASYAVDVVWLTNGVFTDPTCGTQATVFAGSHVNYTLVIQWAKTDEMNWSIQATYDVNGSASGTVSKDGHLWNVTGTVTVHATATFSRSAGTYSFTFSISGLRVITLDDGTETHTVTITTEALDRIFITVDGSTYGPFTLAQVLWIFGFHCGG